MRSLLAAVLLVAACSADLHHTIDAGPADASFDILGSATGDAPSNAVTLVVTRVGMPVPGVAVFFQNADSSLVSASLTNDDGLAFAVMDAGGYVTALERTGNGLDELTTFAAVQPADALTLQFSPTGPLDATTFMLSVPASNSAAAYKIETSCGRAALDVSAVGVVSLTGCNGVADIVVVPTDADDNPVGVLYAPATTVNDGASVAIAGTYSSFDTVTLTYTNVPNSVQFLGAYRALSSSRRAYEQNAGGNPVSNGLILTMAMPPATPSVLTATSEMPVSGQIGQQLVYDWAPSSTTYTLDLTAVRVPPFATSPTFDPATRTLTWTESSGPIQPDLVRARVHAYRDDIPSGRAWGWRIVAPRSLAITYPQLPVQGFDFNIAATDTFGVDDLMTMAVPGGYAGFRPHGFADVISAVSGASGRIIIQTLFFEVL